jgi:predicted nucleic acid-binding protein
VAAFLLDTTVLIDILRGRPQTREKLRALRRGRDSLYCCVVNVEEIVRGLRPTDEEGAQRLLAGLRLAHIGRREAWDAGEWRHLLAARGQSVAQADALIAAAAHSLGATIATGNIKDFPTDQAPLDGLLVEHWPAGQ